MEPAGTNGVIPGVTYTWDQLPKFAQDALKKVAADLGLISVQFKITSGSNVGDGFMSVMQRVVIEGFKVNDLIVNKGKKHEIRVLMKLPPLSKERRAQFASDNLFEREILMYTKFLPLIERFQSEAGLQRYEGVFGYPKCYFASIDREQDEAILIFEDLGVSDYSMWNKFVPMDIYHCTKVVEALGRFHGLSFVLKKQQPEVLKEYQAYNDLMTDMIGQEHMKGMWENYFDNAINAFDENLESNVREKVIEFKNNVVDELIGFVKPDEAEPYAVLNHGDCWINNFMFREGSGKQPTDIAFIDFQISRYASPILDLMYFIFVSTDKDLRQEHYHNLLQTYHASLSHIIHRCGEDPKELFPFEAFQKQLKKFGRFGLPMGLMLIPVITTKAEDQMDMDKVGEVMAEFQRTGVKSAEFQDMEAKWQANIKNVQGRIRDVVIDIIDYGYL